MSKTSSPELVESRSPIGRRYVQTVRALQTADTHSRILAAAMERFMADHYDVVTLNEIADRAGVTRQTVLNHFESKDRLFLAAARRVDVGRDLATPDDDDDALAVLVEGYEVFGDTLFRLLGLTTRVPGVEIMLAEGRESHRAWLQRIWGDRLPPTQPERERRLTALYAATDLYVWKLLRRDLGRSVEETISTMRRLVEGALGVAGPVDDPGGGAT